MNRGKVRDVVDLGQELLITTTDRISAFDRVLTTIPCKGEVLNTLSLFWFPATPDIIPNHVREELSPRTIRAAKCAVLPVRGGCTGLPHGLGLAGLPGGAGVSGIRLPAGMRFNQTLRGAPSHPVHQGRNGHA